MVEVPNYFITPTFILPRQGGGDFAFLLSGVFDICSLIFIKLGVVGQSLEGHFASAGDGVERVGHGLMCHV